MCIRDSSSPAPESLQKTVGMWHQKPTSLNSNTVLRIMSPNEFGEDVNDLSRLLGLKMVKAGVPSRQKIATLGQISNKKDVSEAVVMIPYIDTRSGPKYFLAPEAEVYRAVQFRYPFYQYDYAFAYQRLTGEDNLPAPSEIVENMVDGMLNYVIPPEFNSIKYNGSAYADFRKVSPYLMFFFPFNHSFDQQDLARIWQGVMPKFGENFNKSPGFLFDQNQPSPDLRQGGGLETNFEEMQLSLPLSELEQFVLEGDKNTIIKRKRLVRRADDRTNFIGALELADDAGVATGDTFFERGQQIDQGPVNRGAVRGLRDRRRNPNRQNVFNYDVIRSVFDLNVGVPEDNYENLSSLFKQIKFRIFKVKKRAENDYFRKQALDTAKLFTANIRENREDEEVGRPFESIFNKRQSDFDIEFSVERDVLSYGYNWPYDFFSMIELVKVDAEYELIADRLNPAAAENAHDMFKKIENSGEEYN
mgnify:CR=1 FL=1